MFEENAKSRGLTSQVFDGFWPAVEADVPIADVVVAHHVMYNVSPVEDFLLGMNAHASKRVVIEMPQRHPLTTAAPLWKHFWNLDRPTQPLPTDLMNVLAELGIEAHLELWDGSMRVEADLASQAHFSRIRLCLPESREPEVLEFLSNEPKVAIRNLATIWWDVK
jgi:hypothetical protein